MISTSDFGRHTNNDGTINTSYGDTILLTSPYNTSIVIDDTTHLYNGDTIDTNNSDNDIKIREGKNDTKIMTVGLDLHKWYWD